MSQKSNTQTKTYQLPEAERIDFDNHPNLSLEAATQFSEQRVNALQTFSNSLTPSEASFINP